MMAYSNIENGLIATNFSPYRGNEMDFCKNYSDNNGAIAFNYRGAKTKISRYEFYDGNMGLLFRIDANGFHSAK